MNDLAGSEEGDRAMVTLPGRAPIAVWKVESEVYVTDDTCTHGQASLVADGALDGCIVECGLHFGAFDIRTGEAVTAPCSQPLRTYPVEIVDGNVFTALEEK